jgi:two-component system, cell cycle response regulator
MNEEVYLLMKDHSCRTVIHSYLEQKSISVIDFDHYSALQLAIEDNSNPQLLFVEKSCLGEESDFSAMIEDIRFHYHGGLYVIVNNSSHTELQQLIHLGVTDVVQDIKFEQFEKIIHAYSVFKDTQKSQKDSKVLIVEDSRTSIVMLTAALDEIDLQSTAVPSVEQAIEVLQSENFDLVITDFVLEGKLTAISLVNEMQYSPLWCNIPILVSTGYGDIERHKQLLRLGVKDVLAKPIDLEMLQLKALSLIKAKKTFDMLLEREKELNYIAYHDSMSELYNRTYLKQNYAHWLQNIDQRFCAILIDIDHLKLINDNFGHDIGDLVLADMGQNILDNQDDSEMSIRLGADEILILTDLNTQETAENRAQEIIKKLKGEELIRQHNLTFSVGIVVVSKEFSLSDTLKMVDAALFLAKEDGGGGMLVITD